MFNSIVETNTDINPSAGKPLENRTGDIRREKHPQRQKKLVSIVTASSPSHNGMGTALEWSGAQAAYIAMVTFDSAARFIMPTVVTHQPGFKAIEAYGPQSVGTKTKGVTDQTGVPTDTQEECETAIARVFDFAEAMKLPCSGVFMAYLADGKAAQPVGLANQRKAAQYGLKQGMDCWLSVKGKLCIGHNTTGTKKRRQPGVKRQVSKTEETALAAFLKG